MATSQLEVFKKTAQPLVSSIMDGYNATIFAYGQTGSGKTFTMMGDPKSPEMKGIIPRTIESVFSAIEEADSSCEFTVKLSYVEIYNERVRDLLDTTRTNLKIRESAEGVWIEDVCEQYVTDYETVLDVMMQGQQARAIAATQMNEQSSRSHSVFLFTLTQNNKVSGAKKASKLILVDLAGSEKVLKTGAEGQTLHEAKHINKSLSALGNVINALTKPGGAHVPYRDSKLTRLLSDSLGGNSKTCLIITCSPASTNGEETLSTCRFGARAKNIKNKPKVNALKSVAEYQRLLAESFKKIKVQQRIIKALENDVTTLETALAKAKIPLPELVAGVLRASLPATIKDEELLEGANREKESLLEELAIASSGGVVGGGKDDEDDEGERPRVSAEAMRQFDVDDDAGGPRSPGAAGKGALQAPQTGPSRKKSGAPDEGGEDAKLIAAVDFANLKLQIDTLRKENLDLKEQIQERSGDAREFNEIQAALEQKVKAQQTLLQEEVARAKIEKQHLQDAATQMELMKKKMEQLQSDHKASIDQVKADVDVLTEKLIVSEMLLKQVKAEKRKLKRDLRQLRGGAHNKDKEDTSEEEEEDEEVQAEEEVVAAEAHVLAPNTTVTHNNPNNNNNKQPSNATTTKSSGAASNVPKSSPTSPKSAGTSTSTTTTTTNSSNAAALAGLNPAAVAAAVAQAKQMDVFNVQSLQGLQQEVGELHGKEKAALNYEFLRTALEKKVAQAVELQRSVVNGREQVTILEDALADARKRLELADPDAQKKIKVLEEKLAAAENLCRKLLESGLYWRQQRQKQQSRSRIVTPIVGGGKKKDTVPERRNSVTTLASQPQPRRKPDDFPLNQIQGGRKGSL